MTWNTFLGGNEYDWAYAIAVDTNGSVYVVGYSGATWGSPVRAHTSGGSDAYAAKLDSSGNLIWNTFLGGSGTELGRAIAVDINGNVYVSGYSSATWGSPVRAYTYNYDAFAAKLDSSGHLTWNTFLGGSGTDYGYGIAVDTNGNVYASGESDATWGSPVRSYSGGTQWDTYAVKLDSSGNLTWNTFLGGSGTDTGWAIAVDTIGNVYVGGSSTATWGSPIRAYTSVVDAFAAKLDSSGNLTWNTFLGGSGTDDGRSIAVDLNKNVYIAGYSDASWGSSPVRTYNSGGGGNDSFVAKLPETPLLVSLKSFTKKIKDSLMTIEWSTASEKDNAGFNIWRSEKENGVYEKINNALISAKGTSITGASYLYNDDTIKIGKNYCYKLEDIDTKGSSQFHKPSDSSSCFNVLLGDANGDGKVDLKDAAYILQITSNIKR